MASITIAMIVSDHSFFVKQHLGDLYYRYGEKQGCDILVFGNGVDDELVAYVSVHFPRIRCVSYQSYSGFISCFNQLLSLIHTPGLLIMDPSVSLQCVDIHGCFSELQREGKFAGAFPVIQRDQSGFNRQWLRGCHFSKGVISSDAYSEGDQLPQIVISEAMLFQVTYLKSMCGCVTGYYSVEFAWYDLFFRAACLGWDAIVFKHAFCEKVTGVTAFFSMVMTRKDEHVDRWVFLSRYVSSWRYSLVKWTLYWVTLFSFRPRQLAALVVSFYLRGFYYFSNRKKWSMRWSMADDIFILASPKKRTLA